MTRLAPHRGSRLQSCCSAAVSPFCCYRPWPQGAATLPANLPRSRRSRQTPKDQASPASTSPPRVDGKSKHVPIPQVAKNLAPREETAPVKVRVSHPIVKEVSDYQIFAGHLVAARHADLKARVSGTVIAVACRPGQMVKAGDVLFETRRRGLTRQSWTRPRRNTTAPQPGNTVGQ